MVCSCSLIGNTKFALNEMFQGNVSKYAIFHVIQKMRIFFLHRHRLEYSILKKMAFLIYIRYFKFWSMLLEHFVKRKPFICGEWCYIAWIEVCSSIKHNLPRIPWSARSQGWIFPRLENHSTTNIYFLLANFPL